MTDSSKKVLIADDEEVIRNVCRRSLQEQGYSIVLVENGMSALERMRTTTFDIVFTDIKMPIMSGVELLGAIKRDYPHTEVIMMTAYATVENAIEAMKMGASDFILKPIKPDQIRMVAEKCFEKIQLGAENQALRLANQKLLDLQTMKDKFVAVTSHELRTPVSHLKGYFGILNDELYQQLSDDEKRQCMQVILDAIKDLERIVTQMHELAWVETAPSELRTELFDVNQIIEKAVSDYQVIARLRQQKIGFKKRGADLIINGEGGKIRSIVLELIQNAIKFTPDGGEILVSTKRDAAYCVISVKDNGIGIDPAEHGKIFDKFYEVQDSRYHSSSKNGFMGGGLGLGLASVRAIATAHGGGVKVKSVPEKGSEFLIYLPIADPGESPETSETSSN
ncbi:MAG TPA: response regulator [bacterium]